MGGIYAREEKLPEEVWKAIYFHYLPIGVEADAPPTRTQLGKAAVTWAAVSLADKLDTVVGLFAAGEKPTGSRDPYGLRRAAQSVVRTLVDLPQVTGKKTARIGKPPEARMRPCADKRPSRAFAFNSERLACCRRARLWDSRNVRAVTMRRSGIRPVRLGS
jgi:glycyl-tRNA synthetase beta subunit